MCVYALPGATPAASKMNFMRWPDAVIQGLTKHNTFVTYGGVRQYGFFHQILMSEFVNITSVLSQAFAVCGRDCAANGHSCGVCYYVVGSGDGSTVFSYQAQWGPFLA